IRTTMSSKDSAKRFGFEWSKLTEMEKTYEWQFYSWIGPLAPEVFRGKSVLDAGCGMGRNSYFALSWGAKHVIAFDYDERTVSVARRTLSKFKNARVEYQNIYNLNYKEEFDLVLCIGVIEHLEDPDAAIANLVCALKTGGTLLLWVVGNDRKVMISAVNTLRALTSHIPTRLLWYLVYMISVPFGFALKLLRPKDAYLSHLAHSSLSHVHGIAFDHLLPIITRYYDRDSAFKLIDRPGLVDKTIHHTNNNSWTLVAKKSS
ncbi:MAG: class I SAM-dependent methyltransferase, partial [Nitrososphaerales archaeon]